ncbi:hypothetical protein EJ07DRAFT_176048 [Lizonia empirigonia]|nr:hypothetical protein EJ07DRAFT_176048 [Lizonia empirigonia]
MPMETLGYSSFLTPPFDPGLGENVEAQAALFAPTQAISFDPFVAAEAGVPSEYVNLQPTEMDMHNMRMAQSQQKWQQHGLQTTTMGYYPLQSQTPTQMQLQQGQNQQPFVTGLPSSQTIPGKRSRTPQISNVIVQTPSPPYQPTRSTFTDTAYQNEVAEHRRLEKEQKQRAEEYKNRREELRKDTSAIYHRYNEVLEYLPPSRRERPNPYLASLLANQTVPIEPTSDRGIAITYAKKHWQNFWELKDLQYVISKARADRDDQ